MFKAVNSRMTGSKYARFYNIEQLKLYCITIVRYTRATVIFTVRLFVRQ